MTEDSTLLDTQIEEVFREYEEVYAAADSARRESRRLEDQASAVGQRMQQLLIARSALRDGKAYGFGDANVELNKMRMAASREA